MNWRDDAACLTSARDLFFPVGSAGPASIQVQEAKQVCARCPVRDACLEWALESHVDHGVWGGLSEEERRSMKRRMTRKRSPQRVADPVAGRVRAG